MTKALSIQLNSGLQQDPVLVNWEMPFWVTPRLIFSLCVLVILLVSGYDTYLVCFFRHTILNDERNPICEALIRRDPEGLTWFLLGKAVGNFAVISVLTCLYKLKYKFRNLIAVAVASFQILLTGYLCFADHSSAVLCFEGLHSPNDRVSRQAFYSLLVHLAIVTTLGLTMVAIYSTRESSQFVRHVLLRVDRFIAAVR